MVSGNVGGDQGDPVQGIHGAKYAFGSAVLDVRVVGVVTHPSPREAGAQDVSSQTLESQLVVGFYWTSAVDLEAGVLPGTQFLSKFPAQAVPGDHHLQYMVLKEPSDYSRVDPADRNRGPVRTPGHIACQGMEVGVPIQGVAVGLNGEDGTGNIAWSQAGLYILTKALPGTTAELTQEFPIPAARLELDMLLLVGAGDLREELEQYARTKNIQDQIVFWGTVSDVHRFYQIADVCILPSLSEGLPNALLEAMSCGVPPIGSEIVSIRSIIDHEYNGYLFQNDKAQEFGARNDRDLDQQAVGP